MSASAAPMSTPVAVAAPERFLRLGARRYSLAGPSLGDPRIHLSAVTIAIFVLGIGWLGFRLSIAQILVAMITCGGIEVTVTMVRSNTIAWPASALQTASSTALILRVEGTENGDLWTLHGWYYFAGIAAFGLLTKYAVRTGGRHLFNPSNIALALAFLVIGSDRIEPLDFWWGPLRTPLVIAYIVIVVGGLLICRPLGLIGMGVAFWTTLAAGLGVLAAAGHSVSARWSLTPVAGAHFWWVVMSSPEVLVFLFFMLTDPRTVPNGRVGRIVFGVVVGVLSSLAIAPWQTEFGAKVALLSSLAVVSGARPLLERMLPAGRAPDDRPLKYARRLLAGRDEHGRVRARRVVGAAALVAALGGGVVAASAPARVPAEVPLPPASFGVEIDPADLPPVEIDAQIAGLSATLATPAGAQQLAADLAFNLSIEHEALRTGDASLLSAIDHGDRLAELEQRVGSNGARGRLGVPIYEFATLRLVVVFPGGAQRGPNAGMVATGTVTEVDYSPTGAEIRHTERPFALTFALRQTLSGRWQVSAVTPTPPGEP